MPKQITNTTEELEAMTKAELSHVADKQHVDVNSHMTKAEMVGEIQSANAPTPVAKPSLEKAGSIDINAPGTGPEAVSASIHGETEIQRDGRAALGR